MRRFSSHRTSRLRGRGVRPLGSVRSPVWIRTVMGMPTRCPDGRFRRQRCARTARFCCRRCGWAIGGLAAYPPADDEEAARTALGQLHGRPPEEVLLLNGAAEGFRTRGRTGSATRRRRRPLIHRAGVAAASRGRHGHRGGRVRAVAARRCPRRHSPRRRPRRGGQPDEPDVGAAPGHRRAGPARGWAPARRRRGVCRPGPRGVGGRSKPRRRRRVAQRHQDVRPRQIAGGIPAGCAAGDCRTHPQPAQLAGGFAGAGGPARVPVHWAARTWRQQRHGWLPTGPPGASG